MIFLLLFLFLIFRTQRAWRWENTLFTNNSESKNFHHNPTNISQVLVFNHLLKFFFFFFVYFGLCSFGKTTLSAFGIFAMSLSSIFIPNNPSSSSSSSFSFLAFVSHILNTETRPRKTETDWNQSIRCSSLTNLFRCWIC